MKLWRNESASILLLAHLCVTVTGCAGSMRHSSHPLRNAILPPDVPRELDKANLPEYVVEPPDVLLIEAAHTLRNPDSRLIPGDRLLVKLKNGLPLDVSADSAASPSQVEAELQIEIGFKILSGTYRVESNGRLDFGPSYGKVMVANLTLAEAETAIREHLEHFVGVKSPELSVELEDLESIQQVGGEHLVRSDGRVSLGVYGDVYVSGMTLPQVRETVTQHLAQNGIQDPKVSVDVSTYNSKTFYIISDGGGIGEQVTRLPFTGNETVLDAISQINGLSEVSSKRIWIARPAPAEAMTSQIMMVEWEDITAFGKTETNYQLMPGDRIYIQADRMVAFSNTIEKLVAPVERVLGVSLLGFNVLRHSKGVYPITSNGAGGGFQ